MDTANARLSQNYRVKAGVIHTLIHPNESISSWLIRAALDCGTDPLTFTGFYWEKHRLWTLDLDRGLDNIDPTIYDDIHTLSTQVQLSEHSLFRRLYPINLDETLAKGQVRWVIPRSARNRTHHIGQQYCPLCLDELPYLHNDWRLAWNFGCLKHNVILSDRCYHCGTLYQPHLLSAEKLYLNHCHQCGGKLEQGTIEMSCTEKMALQGINQVLEQNSGLCFGRKVSGKVWFDMLRYFLNLLRRAANKPNYVLAKFLDNLQIDVSSVCSPKTGLSFEQLPLGERINLLVNAYQILGMEMDSIRGAIHYCGGTQKTFMFEQPPDFWQELIALAPVGLNKARKRATIQNKSITTINRRWERLKRKLHLNTE
ncbi:TPA: TniQ family protein [Pasteurella multocida]|nr:TniQ family protein [Pasteurella multocida]